MQFPRVEVTGISALNEFPPLGSFVFQRKHALVAKVQVNLSRLAFLYNVVSKPVLLKVKGI